MAMFILLPSIKFRLRATPQKTFFIVRSFVCLLVAIIFRRREFFFGRAKILEKKFGSSRSFWSKNRWNRSYPSDFGALWSSKISRAIFWRIRPIVPGFRRIWLQFDQIPGRSAEFTKKWHVDFSSCHMMIWWYDEMMVCWYDDMMK